MSRPRLLDLFCGAGGAAMGYHRAGFDVVGVDNQPQPHYPFPFRQEDALERLRRMIDGNWCHAYDAIHASPPCQDFIRGGLQGTSRGDLLTPSRELLEQTGLPYVIENVPGAPMRPDAVLCGSMFGLTCRRHRWFEVSWAEPLMAPASCDHSRPIVGVYGHPHGEQGAFPGMLPGTLESWSEALGIDWMTATELSQAIPPAYTELIGHHLMQTIVAPPRGGIRKEATCGSSHVWQSPPARSAGPVPS